VQSALNDDDSRLWTYLAPLTSALCVIESIVTHDDIDCDDLVSNDLISVSRL